MSVEVDGPVNEKVGDRQIPSIEELHEQLLELSDNIRSLFHAYYARCKLLTNAERPIAGTPSNAEAIAQVKKDRKAILDKLTELYNTLNQAGYDPYDIDHMLKESIDKINNAAESIDQRIATLTLVTLDDIKLPVE